jgi:hypothetical protein
MQHQVLPLWDESNMARIETYLLKDSWEFQYQQKRPAVIVCPGGAYLGTSDREAEPVALRFNAMGYHAVVLRYNTYFYELYRCRSRIRTLSPIIPIPNGPTRCSIWARRCFCCVKKPMNGASTQSESRSAVFPRAAIWPAIWRRAGTILIWTQLGVESSQLRPTAAILGYPVFDYCLMRDLGRTKTR